MRRKPNRYSAGEEIPCDACGTTTFLLLSSIVHELRRVPCSVCNKKLCYDCSPTIYVVDSIPHCQNCMPNDWEQNHPGFVIEWVLGDLAKKKHEGYQKITCKFCNWDVWFSTDTVCYNHACAQANYQAIDNGYRVTFYKHARFVGDQKFQQELVMVARVAQRITGV